MCDISETLIAFSTKDEFVNFPVAISWSFLMTQPEDTVLLKVADILR